MSRANATGSRRGSKARTTVYQQEVRTRLQLPFDLLSDEAFAFADALGLPTFTTGILRLLRRVTFIVADGVVEHVFYPVFPPDRHPAQVLAYLQARAV